MALVKKITTDYGVAATYWRVTDITQNFAEGVAHVGLAGYASKSARDNGATELRRAVLEMQIDAEVTRTFAYTRAKAAPEFEGAADG